MAVTARELPPQHCNNISVAREENLDQLCIGIWLPTTQSLRCGNVPETYCHTEVIPQTYFTTLVLVW